MTLTRFRPIFDAAAILALFGLGVGWNELYAVRNVNIDDLFVIDAAWKMFTGQIPFVDFHLYAAPLAVFQIAFIAALGNTLASLILHASVVNGLCGAVGYGLLRCLRLGPGLSLLYAAATVITFYPPIGLPQPNQHSYFFTLVALLAQVAASRTSTPARTALYYVLASAAAVVGFLCKPAPIGFFLPLFAGLWLLLPRQAWLIAAVGASLGAAVALTVFILPPLWAGASLADLIYYSLTLSHRIGASRGMFELRLFLNVYQFELASAVLALGGALLAPVAFVLSRSRPSRAAVLPYAVATWTIIVIVHFQSITQLPAWLNVGPLFIALGSLHAAFLAFAPRQPHDDGARYWAHLVLILLAAATIFDARRFNRVANEERGYPRTAHLGREVEVSDILGGEPAFSGTRFFTVADRTLVQSPEQIRAMAEHWRSLLMQVRSSPDNPVLLGLPAFFYAAAGKPSPLPITTFRPGYASPPNGTPEYERLRALAARNLQRYEIRYALVAQRKMSDPVVRSLLPEVACGIQEGPGFSLFRFCEPSSRTTLDFVMAASGLASSPELR